MEDCGTSGIERVDRVGRLLAPRVLSDWLFLLILAVLAAPAILVELSERQVVSTPLVVVAATVLLWLVWPGLRRARGGERLCAALHLAAGAAAPMVAFDALTVTGLSTVAIVSSLTMGDGRLLARNLIRQLVAFGFAVGICGLDWSPVPSATTVWASLPLLGGCPVLLACRTRRVVTALSEQSRLFEVRSRLDAMTGLYNRSYLETVLPAAFSRCHSGEIGMVLILIDLDRFKQINDRFGHRAGDGVIREMAALLRFELRERDLAGRYGGDEFWVLLTDASEHNAISIVERLRAGLKARVGGLDETVTASFGIAVWTPELKDWRHWVHCADMALYAAKHDGRDIWSVVTQEQIALGPSMPVTSG